MSVYIDNSSSDKVYFDEFIIERTEATVAVVVQENHYYPFGMNMKGIEELDLQSLNSKDEHRFQYNGKEKEESFGLNWTDYGWRNYDMQLGRFTKIDRFSEKYYPLSSYSYVANNPLKYIDINGDSIIIRGSAEFRAEAFKQLQLLTNDQLSMDETGSVTITEKGGVNGDKSLEYGTNLVEGLIKGGTWGTNTFKIVDNTDGKTFVNPKTGKKEAGNHFIVTDNHFSQANAEHDNEIGSGGTIYFDLNRKNGGLDVNGSSERPIHIGLGHELTHAEHSNQGRMFSLEDSGWIDGDNPNATVSAEENYSRIQENILRREQGIAPRILPYPKE